MLPHLHLNNPTCRQKWVFYIHSIDEETPHQRWCGFHPRSQSTLLQHMAQASTEVLTLVVVFSTLHYSVCVPQTSSTASLGVSHMHTQACIISRKRLRSLSVVITLSLDLEPKTLLTYAAFFIHKGFRFQHPLSFSFFSTWALKDHRKIRGYNIQLINESTEKHNKRFLIYNNHPPIFHDDKKAWGTLPISF